MHHTATITLAIPGSTRTIARTLTGTRKTLAHRVASWLRDYAARYGVSPLAVNYAVRVH